MGLLRARVLVILTSAALLGSSLSAGLSSPSAADESGRLGVRAGLPLGPAGLAETRSVQKLQPGVTLTTIVRGSSNARDGWTVEMRIPTGSSSPDPDAPATTLSDRITADQLAERLSAAGFSPRVEPVDTPPTADYVGGRLGWRVRVGRFVDRPQSEAVLSRLVAAGFAGTSRFTGWDGSARDRGPWRLQVLSIDPAHFRGRLLASYGRDVEDRETTSELSQAVGATAAVNGGYFVLDPAAGAPGDPAGIGVYGGKLLSENVARRPALVLTENARHTSVRRLTWTGTLVGHAGARLVLDGVNRVPGLIRNCGGTADDLPTASALHDFTCTDADELVAFTPQFGTRTPAGPGLEAITDRHDRVVSLRSPRGGPLLTGYHSFQATGSMVGPLRTAAALGSTLAVSADLRTQGGRAVSTLPSTSIVNGGPELVRQGAVHVTPLRDGFVRPTDPSFYYGFSSSRNPRTFAGVDGAGRTMLVTADGRSTSSLGLSITETGAVAQALGMRNALNLDGGGSTTMVVGGRVTNQPSDATGERPVGDSLLILPTAR